MNSLAPKHESFLHVKWPGSCHLRSPRECIPGQKRGSFPSSLKQKGVCFTTLGKRDILSVGSDAGREGVGGWEVECEE